MTDTPKCSPAIEAAIANLWVVRQWGTRSDRDYAERALRDQILAEQQALQDRIDALVTELAAERRETQRFAAVVAASYGREPDACEHCGAFDIDPHLSDCPDHPDRAPEPSEPETPDGMPA